MIWRRRPAPGVHRPVDQATFLGAQWDLLTAQLDVERRRNAVLELENARLRAALAPYKHQELMRLGLQQFMAQGAANARRIAEEPTAQVTTDQLRRSRPAPATEQYRRPR